MTIPNHDTVLIIDFGSQVTQLIARRLRETGVYCEIHPYQKADEAFLKLRPKAIILSGGPDSVTRAGSPRAPEAVFASGLPIMAICYGQQTTASGARGLPSRVTLSGPPDRMIALGRSFRKASSAFW